MSDTPFIKFFPSDFLAGTSGLSPAERGVYITILCLIYEANGPIARDDARLARRCGMPKAAFLRVISELIDQNKIIDADGMLSNNTAEKLIVDRTNRIQNATHAAKQKWAAQSKKSQQNQRRDDAVALRAECVEVCQPEPEPEPDIKKEPKGSTKKRRKPLCELPENWVPSDTNIKHAANKGFAQLEIDHEANQFRNFHHSKQNQYRDWDAAWRTWIGNAAKRRGGGTLFGQQATFGHQQGGSIASIAARRRREGSV